MNTYRPFLYELLHTVNCNNEKQGVNGIWTAKKRRLRNSTARDRMRKSGIEEDVNHDPSASSMR